MWTKLEIFGTAVTLLNIFAIKLTDNNAEFGVAQVSGCLFVRLFLANEKKNVSFLAHPIYFIHVPNFMKYCELRKTQSSHLIITYSVIRKRKRKWQCLCSLWHTNTFYGTAKMSCYSCSSTFLLVYNRILTRPHFFAVILPSFGRF